MSGALIFGTAARRAILARTFLDSSREFYLRELVRLTGFAPRTVNQEIDRLVASDLLTERRHGNRRYLSANERHPLFRPIREIVLKTDGLAGVLSEALGIDGVDFAFVFGSIAAAAAKGGSDIDLLIVGDIGLREAVKRLAPAQDQLEHEIVPIVWTLREFERRRQDGDHFLSDILRGPRIVVVGSEP